MPPPPPKVPPSKVPLSGIPKPSAAPQRSGSSLMKRQGSAVQSGIKTDPSTKTTMPQATPAPTAATASSQSASTMAVPKAKAPTPPVEPVQSSAQPTISQAPTQVQVVQQAPIQTSDAPSNWKELEVKYKQDIEALTESTEMATIEKEIAEEKLDNCERELQEIKDKLAEATLQIDMLKREQQANEPVTSATNETTVTALQLQKVEEQNELLKQALFKLRDISSKDKKTLEDLQIEHESLQEKLLDLEEREQKYLDQIKIYEEQIDVSQSAQEMVEKLTQQKTDLEDKLREMADDLDCMEKLRDLNEQLLESSRENEIELTAQLDKMQVQISELTKKKRDVEEYLSHQERALFKLKDENRQLSDQIVLLTSQFKEGESIQQQKHQIENVAYKLNFSESKMAEKEAEVARYKRNLADLEEQMNSLSLITKEQSTRLDELKLQYDARVTENLELQRVLKKKIEEVSELEIRREMAEKKLLSLQRDTENKISNLNKTIETMKGREVEHEEEMKKIWADYDSMAAEKKRLKEELNMSNRSFERSMQAGNQSISMFTAQDNSLASLGISFQATPSCQSSPIHGQQQGSTLQNQPPQTQMSQATSLGSFGGGAQKHSLSSDVDDSLFMSRIKGLGAAFDLVNKRNYDLEIELAMNELNSKIPPFCKSRVSDHYDIDKAKHLRSEVQRLKREVRMAMINQEICTKSQNIRSQLRNDRFNNSKLTTKYQMLENEVSSLMSNSSLARIRPKAPLLQSTPVK